MLVIISTYRGLCGSLNQNMFKQALEWYKDHPKGKFIVVADEENGVYTQVDNYAGAAVALTTVEVAITQ